MGDELVSKRERKKGERKVLKQRSSRNTPEDEAVRRRKQKNLPFLWRIRKKWIRRPPPLCEIDNDGGPCL